MSISRRIVIVILILFLCTNTLSCSKEKPATSMIGDVYGIGEYYTVNKKGNISDSPMDFIKWKVIGTYEDKVIMISLNILDVLPILPQDIDNDNVIKYIINWLNTDFL